MGLASRILEELTGDGYRITRARRALVSLLVNANLPLGAPEIGERLASDGVRVNKTTVYRELEFLKGRGYVVEVLIGDGLRRFELKPEGRSHHHHLVCTECNSVACVEIEQCIGDQLKQIEEHSNFKVKEHSLKLFGVCQRCQG